MKKLRTLLLTLCALMGVVPAAEAKPRKPPKPAYDFIYSRDRTVTQVSRCPIVPTGGFKTVTTEVIETIWQSGRLDGAMYEMGSRTVNQKQEVEDSEYVLPYDLKGEPLKYDNATKAKDVAKVRKGKVTFEYSGPDKDQTMVLRPPAKKGQSVRKPIDVTLQDDPVDGGNGCTHTTTTKFTAGLRITRTR